MMMVSPAKCSVRGALHVQTCEGCAHGDGHWRWVWDALCMWGSGLSRQVGECLDGIAICDVNVMMMMLFNYARKGLRNFCLHGIFVFCNSLANNCAFAVNCPEKTTQQQLTTSTIHVRTYAYSFALLLTSETQLNIRFFPPVTRVSIPSWIISRQTPNEQFRSINQATHFCCIV